MGLKDVDLVAAMRRLAEKRIEDAIEEGKFDNLPGAGRPLELDPAPADEDARATWWALRILRNANVTPDEFRYRRTIIALRGRIARCRSEAEIRPLVSEHNEMVRRLNTMGTNAVRDSDARQFAPLDEEAEIRRLRNGAVAAESGR